MKMKYNINSHSHTGTNHGKDENNNQDSIVYGSNEDFETIVLADGVSSCKKGGIGAKVTTEAIKNYFLQNGRELMNLDEESRKEVIVSLVKKALKEQAEKDGIDYEEYASTLATILIDKKSNNAITFNIGDSIILGRKDDKMIILGMPADSRNGIPTTVDFDARKNARSMLIESVDGKPIVDCFLLASDGAWQQLYYRGRLKPNIREMLINNDFDKFEEIFKGKDTADDCSYIILDSEEELEKDIKSKEDGGELFMDEREENLTVYKQIARDALMNWNGLSEEEATKKVLESSNEELEQQVYAEGSIDYALKGLQKYSQGYYANRYGFGSPINDHDLSELKDLIMNGGKNLESTGISVPDFYHVIKHELGFYGEQTIDDEADMIISVLSTIHDGWVQDNQKKFFARDKKYQHMPIELIGWKEAKSDLLFLSPILSDMGMDLALDDEILESAYDRKVVEFFKERGIADISELQEHISEGAEFYPALEGQTDILEAMQNPEFVAETIIPSIEEHGVGADQKAMEGLEELKDRRSRLASAKARKQELQQEASTIGEAEKLIDEKENQGQNIE